MLIRSLASLMTSRRGALVARCAAAAFERLFPLAAREAVSGAWRRLRSVLAVSAS